VSAEGKKLVLAVIDGLPPEALERSLDQGRLPTLARLAEEGVYTRGISAFPSLTPVCLATIATGAAPDVHGIPHLVWYHREEQRIVEYGSSLAAVMAAGLLGTLRDSVIGMAGSHLAPEALTVFEALEDAGLVTGAINFTCYRGRHRHRIRLPQVASRNRWYESVLGPRRFFFFNLYESDDIGAPLAVRSRTAGSVDAYAVAAGRWLVTRDGFDFLVYYLPDYDYAAHAAGPDASAAALDRSDASLARLLEAAGGIDRFLERYALLVVADHGQTGVDRVLRLADRFDDLRVLSPRRPHPTRCDIAIAASNRAAMVYRMPDARVTTRELALQLDGEPAADVTFFLEGDEAVVRREGDELRFALGEGGMQTWGDTDLLDVSRYPDGLARAWHALRSTRAGDLIVSAAEGFEFVDLGGRHHRGGGSHGSLLAGDSFVPMIAAGFDDDPLPASPSIADLAPLALRHFGVEPPSTMGHTVRSHA
jgi:Type I phosphodiesterase / nucleotide pyrophosphatase